MISFFFTFSALKGPRATQKKGRPSLRSGLNYTLKQRTPLRGGFPPEPIPIPDYS